MAFADRLTDNLRRAADSDIYFSFRQSWLTMAAAGVTLLFVAAAMLAPLLDRKSVV